MEITFKKAGIEDLEEVQKLAMETFYAAFASLNTEGNMKFYMDRAFSKEQLGQELTEANSIFLLAQIGGKTAGYLKLNLGPAQTDLQDPEALEIQRIYVHPDYQNLKLGEQMVRKAISVAHERNLKYIWLGVWEKNLRAIRFYERQGFIQIGQHPFPFGDDLQTDLIMKLTP